MQKFKKTKSFGQKKFEKNDGKKSFQSKKERNQEVVETIVGVYSQSVHNDFGFIDVEGIPKGYFVHPVNLNGALDGDEVEADVVIFNRRKEAIVTKISKRAKRVLVGKLQRVKDYAFVILDNPAFKNDVFIKAKELGKQKIKVKDGDKVAIEIIGWNNKNPEGKIIEVLGDETKRGVDIMGLALEAGMRISFPESVLSEAEKLTFESQKHRVDLTDKLIFTIDGEDAKDLDDAVFLEKVMLKNVLKNFKTPGVMGYKLLVSIADVAEYVKEGTQLDKEAFKRGNSTYLVDRVIPMLPEKLSNDLCSLNPHTKKLTLTCEMILDQDGNILLSQVYESIIESKFRLTYKEVQEIIDGKKLIGSEFMFGGVCSEDLHKTVMLLEQLKKSVQKRKKDAGILDFDFPETKILLDAQGHPTEIKKYDRYESMKIIEECMVLANEAVGKLFHKIPFLYRIHPVPSDDDIDKLRTTLALFGIALPYKKMTPKVMSEVLLQVNAHKKSSLLSKLVLRSLEKAIYSGENEGHFGLGLEFYSHFTSPIRRYPDLFIHRIMKEMLSKKWSERSKEHFAGIVEGVGKKTSETERKSEKLEYVVRDLMIAKYYQDKIGHQEIGVISGMIPSGFFVELPNTAEGLVTFENISKVSGKHVKEISEETLSITFQGGEKLQIGDTIEIVVSEVDMERRRLNFGLVKIV